MALNYLTNFDSVPKSERLLIRSKIFKLPPFPKDREFCWDCRPPPSWEAITQGQEPDKNPREPTTVSDTALIAVTDPGAEQLRNQIKLQIVGSGGEPEEEPEEESSEQRSQERIQEPSQDFSLDANHRRDEQPDEELDLRSRRNWWFGPLSSSSESEEDVYFFSDEYKEGDDDDKNKDGDDDESNGGGATLCILRPPSETDSDDYEYPDRLQILNRPINQYRARPVRDFGPDLTGKEECLDLERAPLGLQFWDSMVLNPEGGPGKYMRPIEDMSVYYQKWFRFLCPEDMAFHQKFRYVWDKDWL
ncbi:hypothetical protein EYZ11_008577 [Aspergillus tanneri]|uniref:Uncharacterized protein n=1 Tax=Aspergillus tanneri TaxID=1220188 RepID=A0A4S3JFL3_9EURO|nr:hypothetical protein EYZ11_008577 [Aspergillus tanneri]